VSLARYYRFHAGIYDWTRWSFLFGRRAFIEDLASREPPGSVLEIGCGTGTNLRLLGRRLPEAELFGVDLSTDMLRRAHCKLASFGERVQLHRGRFPGDSKLLGLERRFDLIVFSYSLSMFGDDWSSAIDAARESLSSRGLLAALDFHDCRLPGFKEWMRLNHVRLDGQLLPALRTHLTPRYSRVHPVMFGAWSYFSFVGARSQRAGT
jgi:S-adenosylmethionine-diacylgycerolhomoserine-N-methlytransferase